MVIVPSNRDSEAGVLPDQKLLENMGKYNEQLVRAGVMRAAEGLHPTSKGKRVKFSGNQPTVIDGPFSGSGIAGFWLLETGSMDEVVEWVKRAPFGGGVEIEIRPIFEAADFGDRLSPEMRRQEEEMRSQLTGARR